MAKSLTILHNPRCSKSREALALIETRGEQVEVIEYLKDAPTVELLKDIVNKLGLAARAIVRTKEEAMKGLDLDLDDEVAVLEALAAHPILIERPIIIRGDKAVIGRPPEKVARLWA